VQTAKGKGEFLKIKGKGISLIVGCTWKKGHLGAIVIMVIGFIQPFGWAPVRGP
jgi:hypothetical protein